MDIVKWRKIYKLEVSVCLDISGRKKESFLSVNLSSTVVYTAVFASNWEKAMVLRQE